MRLFRSAGQVLPHPHPRPGSHLLRRQPYRCLGRLTAFCRLIQHGANNVCRQEMIVPGLLGYMYTTFVSNI